MAAVTGLPYLLQGLGPFFALLSPVVRNSRRSMIAIAVVTLAMTFAAAAAVQWVPERQPNWVDASGWALETRSA